MDISLWKIPQGFWALCLCIDPWHKRLCCHQIHMSCSSEGSRERACTCSPLSCSHLPSYACLCNPAAFLLIILPADPCLMVVSGLQHHEFSDCCSLYSLTWQLKMIYKWLFQFQIESSKRLQCLLWYQRRPAISAAAFAVTACLSLGFYTGCLLSTGCFVTALCRAWGVIGTVSLLETVAYFQ